MPDQVALHPHLTLTGISNVLEKLRSGEALNAKETQIHDDGLVTIWAGLPYAPCQEAFEEEILTCLVALNHERAAEEKRASSAGCGPSISAPPPPAPPSRSRPRSSLRRK